MDSSLASAKLFSVLSNGSSRTKSRLVFIAQGYLAAYLIVYRSRNSLVIFPRKLHTTMANRAWRWQLWIWPRTLWEVTISICWNRRDNSVPALRWVFGFTIPRILKLTQNLGRQRRGVCSLYFYQHSKNYSHYFSPSRRCPFELPERWQRLNRTWMVYAGYTTYIDQRSRRYWHR